MIGIRLDLSDNVSSLKEENERHDSCIFSTQSILIPACALK